MSAKTLTVLKDMMIKIFLFVVGLITASAVHLFGQTTFTKSPGTPVVSRTTVFGVWDAIAVSDPHILLINDTLKMWYTGVGWLSTADTSIHQRVGLAWSLDGISWTQDANNPVLDRSVGAWDNLGVETPGVLVDSLAPPPERFKMWYAGQNADNGIYDIGYAFSSDGINWNKHPDPVLQTGASNSWENAYLEGPCVLLHDDTLRMWYASVDIVGNGQPTDFTGNIGYAWSLDGINWNKHSDNPIFTSYDSEGWDLASVADPHVIFHDGMYHMWYAGLTTWAAENFKMGYAFSADGINWTRPIDTPSLETGASGEWDEEDASYGCAIFNPLSNQYEMWYTGIDTNFPSSNINGYYYDIGRAVAESTLSVDPIDDSPTKVVVYPNPVAEKVTLKGDAKEFNWILITNGMGQDVTSQTGILQNSPQTVTIDLKQLSPGIYFIQTPTTTNKVYKK